MSRFYLLLATFLIPSTYIFIFVGTGATFTLVSLLLYLATYFFVLTCFGFLLLQTLAPRYFEVNTAFLLAIPTSIITYSCIFIVLRLLSAPSLMQPVIGLILFAGLLVLNLKRKPINRVSQVCPSLLDGLVVAFIISVICCLFLIVNIDRPVYQLTAEYVSKRAFFKLPEDNFLQFLSSFSLLGLHKPWATASWTMGDRPPLAALLYSASTYYNGTSHKPVFWHYQILMNLLNSLYLIPLCFLGFRIFRDLRVAKLLTVSIGLNQFFFLNNYFSWPKLFAVYFILLIICSVLEFRKFPALISGVLFGLASLSHTGAMLSLPLLFVLFLYFQSRRPLIILASLVLFSVSFLATLYPWNLYKAEFPELKTYNLIHDHYFPTKDQREIFSRDFPSSMTIFFKENHSIPAQLETRFHNVKTLMKTFAPHFPETLSETFRNSSINQFYSPLYLLGVGKLILGAILCAILAHTKLTSSNSKFTQQEWRAFFFTLIFVALSYLLLAFTKWTEPSNHALPYLEPLLALGILYGIFYSLNSLVRYFLFSLSIVEFMYFVIGTSQRHKFNVWEFHNTTIYFLAAALCLFGVIANKEKSKHIPIHAWNQCVLAVFIHFV